VIATLGRQLPLAALLLGSATSLLANPGEGSVPGAHSLRNDPQISAALSRFAFLVGTWTCKARLKITDQEWETFDANWTGSFILHGHAIADEYEMRDSAGKMIVLGMNFRSYDAANKVWNLRWLNALSGEWTDLAPKEFGGAKITENSISYFFKEPVAAQAYTRATYTNISRDHFTWIGEKSDDAKSWADFMRVECRRVSN
jgi:hypothetical protein